MKRKRIVCFGDSNTWGASAEGKSLRYDEDARWTGVLQRELGDGYLVIEEGLNGRTTVWDDPIEQYKNGHKYLMPMMESHKPFDLIMIMLGTNDLKRRFNLSAHDIAQGAALLAREAVRSDCGKDGNAPKVLLAAPIEIDPNLVNSRLAEMFEPDAIERSKQISRWLLEYSRELGCDYINAAEYAKPDPRDGIHLLRESHETLGIAVAEKIRALIG